MKKNILITIAMLLLVITVNAQGRMFTIQFYDTRETIEEATLDEYFIQFVRDYKVLRKNIGQARYEFSKLKDLMQSGNYMYANLVFDRLYNIKFPTIFNANGKYLITRKDDDEFRKLTKQQRKVNEIRGCLLDGINGILIDNEDRKKKKY